MKRQEEILNKAIDYSEIEENFLEYDDCGDVCDDKTFIEKAFIAGAEWADATLIEKMCNYLRGQVYQEYPGGPLERLITDEMIDQFIKIMED